MSNNRWAKTGVAAEIKRLRQEEAEACRQAVFLDRRAMTSPRDSPTKLARAYRAQEKHDA